MQVKKGDGHYSSSVPMGWPPAKIVRLPLFGKQAPYNEGASGEVAVVEMARPVGWLLPISRSAGLSRSRTFLVRVFPAHRPLKDILQAVAASYGHHICVPERNPQHGYAREEREETVISRPRWV